MQQLSDRRLVWVDGVLPTSDARYVVKSVNEPTCCRGNLVATICHLGAPLRMGMQ